jgi:hypothetical protein
MYRRVLLVLVCLGASLTLSGCAEKEGSGVEASETRDVEAFSRIELNGQADVIVTIGGQQTMTVRADDNLLGDINTEVEDSTLEISQTGNVDLQPRAGITIEIALPNLDEVEVSGSGNVTVSRIDGGTLRIEVSGSGDVEATGQVEQVEADLSGSGELRLAQLVARNASIDVSGSGDAHVHATNSLAASVSGSGTITYAGNPPNVDTDVSGSGDVTAA